MYLPGIVSEVLPYLQVDSLSLAVNSPRVHVGAVHTLRLREAAHLAS